MGPDEEALNEETFREEPMIEAAMIECNASAVVVEGPGSRVARRFAATVYEN